jgi:branched-chain amino acid transport system permease protein
MLLQQLFNALVLGSVYALFALGFTLTFGVLRVINLLTGFYFAAGAFAALAAVHWLGLGLVAAGLAGAVVAGLAGMACDTVLLTPLRRARAPELSSLMVTLGGVLLMDSVMQIGFGAEVRRFPAGLLDQSAVALGPVAATPIQLAIVAVVPAVVAALFAFIRRTRLGTAIRAVAERPDTAAMMGIDVGAVVALVSFLSASLAGGAGILIGLDFNAVHPYMGQPMMLRGFAVIVIGGLGSVPGALVAGLGLGFLEVMTAGYLSSELKDAVPFCALILVLWLRPSGLFGHAAVKRA